MLMKFYFDDEFAIGQEEEATPAPPNPFYLGREGTIELTNGGESGSSGGRVA